MKQKKIKNIRIKKNICMICFATVEINWNSNINIIYNIYMYNLKYLSPKWDIYIYNYKIQLSDLNNTKISQYALQISMKIHCWIKNICTIYILCLHHFALSISKSIFSNRKNILLEHIYRYLKIFFIDIYLHTCL